MYWPAYTGNCLVPWNTPLLIIKHLEKNIANHFPVLLVWLIVFTVYISLNYWGKYGINRSYFTDFLIFIQAPVTMCISRHPVLDNWMTRLDLSVPSWLKQHLNVCISGTTCMVPMWIHLMCMSMLEPLWEPRFGLTLAPCLTSGTVQMSIFRYVAGNCQLVN